MTETWMETVRELVRGFKAEDSGAGMAGYATAGSGRFSIHVT